MLGLEHARRLPGPGRSFLVERGLTSQAELEALVADYVAQSERRDEPAVLVRLDTTRRSTPHARPAMRSRCERVEAYIADHAGRLERAVVWRVNPPLTLVQDVCSYAWLQLWRRADVRLDHEGFAWLCRPAEGSSRVSCSACQSAVIVRGPSGSATSAERPRTSTGAPLCESARASSKRMACSRPSRARWP
ncbi:MAG: hypothetical protein E6G10_24510 [Actinobacteria bacterium]|nr:MAG: hypothetical protein E6G10_24510 [Actinomycetota bacterium]